MLLSNPPQQWERGGGRGGLPPASTTAVLWRGCGQPGRGQSAG